MKSLLNKSVLLKGLQCQKHLYLHLHHPELESEALEFEKAIRDQGTEVGLAARSLYPGGKLIEMTNKPDGALEETQFAIERGDLVLFEAAFVYQDILIRADILKRETPTSPWELIEVKSSAHLRDEHIQDVALQYYVLKGAALAIQSASVLSLNSNFVFPEKGELFKKVDVTERCETLINEIPDFVDRIKNIIAREKIPPIEIGPHCRSPFQCGFEDYCRSEKKIPKPSVLDLPRLGPEKWHLYSQGIIELSDVRLLEPQFNLRGVQLKMIDAFQNRTRSIHREEIARILSEWQRPLIYLDFETINPAIPRFLGASPYQHIAFQFSVHIEKDSHSPTPALEHHEFLETSDADPRRALIESLIRCIPDSGSVVAYYKQFEAGRLEEMAQCFPEYAAKLDSIRARLVDPLPIFQQHVYDHGFMGSFSIKKVAPALIGESLSYDGMEVGDGMAAQRAYEELRSQQTTPERKTFLRKSLLDYCAQDTLAMVKLVEWLRNPQ